MTEAPDPIAALSRQPYLPLAVALDATETASSPVQGGDGVRNISVSLSSWVGQGLLSGGPSDRFQAPYCSLPYPAGR